MVADFSVQVLTIFYRVAPSILYLPESGGQVIDSFGMVLAHSPFLAKERVGNYFFKIPSPKGLILSNANKDLIWFHFDRFQATKVCLL